MNKVTTLLVALSFGLFAPSLISCGDKVEDIDQPTKEEKVAQAKADAEEAKAGVYELEINFSSELDSANVGFSYTGLYDAEKCSPAFSAFVDSLKKRDSKPEYGILLLCTSEDAPAVFKSPLILTTTPDAHGCMVSILSPNRGSARVKGYYNGFEILDKVLSFPAYDNLISLGVAGLDVQALQKRLGIKDEN